MTPLKIRTEKEGWKQQGISPVEDAAAESLVACLIELDPGIFSLSYKRRYRQFGGGELPI